MLIIPRAFLRPITTLFPVLLAAVPACRAQAQVSFVNMFRSDSSLQTGNGNTLTSQGYFFSAGLSSQNAGDFTDASLSYPGPASPVTLSSETPTNFGYQTPFFPTQAAMDAAFPMGTYTFSATGGNAGPATATLDYLADGYPTTQPYLTGTDYTNLQNVSALAPITAHFSSFATNATAASQFEFFTIVDTTLGSLVYDAGFLPPATPSITIASDTLQPGHSYRYELIDSNRFSVSGAGGQFAPLLGFDLRTNGAFSTAAVPEPGSGALFVGMSLAGAAFLRRRKQISNAA